MKAFAPIFSPLDFMPFDVRIMTDDVQGFLLARIKVKPRTFKSFELTMPYIP